jgi:hypothetical protein
MATSVPTVTGWSSFWSLTGDKAAYTMINDAAGRSHGSVAYNLTKWATRNEFRDFAALLAGLIGAASGSNVTKTYVRELAPAGPSGTTPVPTQIGDFGGNVQTETVTSINRNTTATDVSTLKDMFNGNLEPRSMTYPTVSGSGGAGKLVNGGVSF